MSINSDGSKLASGGLDGNVKIWDVQSILKFQDYNVINKYGDSNNDDNKTSKKRKIEPSILDDLPSESLQRPLCSMSRHNGVVTSVKFSPDGRFLASGSDDKIVLIWEKDEEQTNRPKQFGESEADLEHWTVRKRLVAHDNDIQDICWSPDGSLLVTVGLDRSIIIWNGLTFERIKRYDIHQSMVKGIVFDPANKFFATASDDRTVRIFRYYKKLNESSLNNYEFQMEHIVLEPFKKSPLTTYFRRMSWSPDGQHIAVPNATNGPVSSVAIINRGNWGTDISLIGHEAPCEVCSFSPRLFKTNDQLKIKSNDDTNKNFSTILATAGQDQNLAIWNTSQSKPLVVAQDIVSDSVTDICWAPSGETLFLSCQDGSITCVIFEKNELGEVISADMNDLQLHRYGTDRESAIFAESTEQLLLEDKAKSNLPSNRLYSSVIGGPKQGQLVKLDTKSSTHVTSQEEKPIDIKKPLSFTSSTTKKSASPPINSLTSKEAHKLSQNITITKSGKKRVAPLLVSSISSGSPVNVDTSSLNKSSGVKKFQTNSKLSQTSYYLPRLGIQSSVHGIKTKSTNGDLNSTNRNAIEDQDNDNEDMGIDLNNDTTSNHQTQNLSGTTLKKKKRKLKRLLMESRYPNCFKLISNLPETLFTNKSILNNEINEIMNTTTTSDMINSSSLDTIDEDLLFQVIVNGIKHIKNPIYTFKTSANHDEKQQITSIIEVRNGPRWSEDDEDLVFEYNDKIDFQDPTVVIVSNTESKQYKKYTLYYPFKIQHVLPVIFDEYLYYYVLVSFHGTMQIVFAESGNMLTPSFEIGENIINLKQSGQYLMALTNSGLIYCWNLPNFDNNQNKSFKGTIQGVSIATILNSENFINTNSNQNSNLKKGSSLEVATILSNNVKSVDIDPKDGSPYIILEGNSSIFKYSIDLMTWTKIVDPWYYLSMNDDLINELDQGLLSRLIRKNYKIFKDDLKRLKISNYVFNSEETKNLKNIMVTRFNEIIESKS